MHIFYDLANIDCEEGVAGTFDQRGCAVILGFCLLDLTQHLSSTHGSSHRTCISMVWTRLV